MDLIGMNTVGTIYGGRDFERDESRDTMVSLSDSVKGRSSSSCMVTGKGVLQHKKVASALMLPNFISSTNDVMSEERFFLM